MRFNSFYKVGLVLMLTLAFLVSCAPKQEDQAKVREAIAAVNEKFAAAVEKGDAGGVAALYTQDAQLLPPNGDFVTGPENIQAQWQQALDMGVKSIKLETLEVESMGQTAYEVGKYAVYAEGEQMVEHGKYIVIWKKIDDEWKLHRDIWNSSVPVPSPPQQ